VLWKSRKSPIIIPAEVHEKLSRTSTRIDEVPSEVVAVRTLPNRTQHDSDSDGVPSPRKAGLGRRKAEPTIDAGFGADWIYP
jgi:hypothetical protein